MRARHPAGCHCCEAATDPTPEVIDNRSGLPAIRYRVGTYASFRQAMVESMARRPELAGLATRGDDDFGIALLDLWAYVGDVLTFYQERIANEAFLGTATLRDSTLHLVAALGYRPRPGFAASVELAFALEPGKRLSIPASLRVQSVPAPGEQAQKFETRAAIEGDAALNRLTILPAPTAAGVLAAGSTEAFLRPGWDPRRCPLAANDALVFFGGGISSTALEEKTVVAIERDSRGDRLIWSPPLVANAGTSASCWRVRRKLKIFGHDAPAQYTKTTADPALNARFAVATRTSWSVAGGPTLDLDARYDDLKIGTTLLAVTPTFRQAVTVTGTAVVAAAFEPFAASVTSITVQPGLGSFDRRELELYELFDPEVPLWDCDYPGATISGASFVVRSSSPVPAALAPKRTVLLVDGTGKSELTTVQAVSAVSYDQSDHWLITVSPAVPALDARTAELLGNVVTAVHGETVRNEVAGDGDASRPFQRFKLKRSPVAFDADPAAPRGAASSIELRVGGVAWREVGDLYGWAPDDPVFVPILADDDSVTLQLGDGRTGARAASGRANVSARYRQGGGRQGNVKSRAITALLDRPSGLKGVLNPDEAKGGTDPESLAEARRSAPATVRTFDRVVSLSDFADAARLFPGIAKARASLDWVDGERAVHLVAAGVDGAAVTGLLAQKLRRYLDVRRDRHRVLRVTSYVAIDLDLEAVLHVDPRFVPEAVRSAAEETLRAALSFDALELGEKVNLSDLYAVLQKVEGVAYVDINRLTFHGIAGMSAEERRRRAIALRPNGGLPDPVQPRLLLKPEELARLHDLTLVASHEGPPA